MYYRSRVILFLTGALILSACERPSSAIAPEKKSESATSPSKETPEDRTYGDRAEKTREIAILAGGCFWGMEDILRDIEGVLETEVGYAGGTLESPTYEDVKKGTTGHAESVRIVFDKTKVSFDELLEKWFFRMHDPTTMNQQGNDVGMQYRSAIFFTSEEQRTIAEEVIRRVSASGQWKKPIVTEVSAATEFTSAESYHQDYLQKNPGGYTCHYLREPVY